MEDEEPMICFGDLPPFGFEEPRRYAQSETQPSLPAFFPVKRNPFSILDDQENRENNTPRKKAMRSSSAHGASPLLPHARAVDPRQQSSPSTNVPLVTASVQENPPKRSVRRKSKRVRLAEDSDDTSGDCNEVKLSSPAHGAFPLLPRGRASSSEQTSSPCTDVPLATGAVQGRSSLNHSMRRKRRKAQRADASIDSPVDDHESDTGSVPMDDDIEMGLTTTIEFITQLPSPKPHSVFVLKGLDKKKTVLILPAHVSLIDGELYNLAATPPGPITLQLLQPASTNRLSFEETPTHLVRLLKSSQAMQHAELGFMAPSTGDKASDIERFGGERQHLAAKSWRHHTVDNLSAQSAMRILDHLLHHHDHALITIICKSFQREWTELVQGETFICGGGCGETRRFDETGYTFELVLERAAVAAVTRKAVADGVHVCGFKVFELLASPASGNVVLSCQHCPNICKGTVTPTQQTAILAKIRL